MTVMRSAAKWWQAVTAIVAFAIAISALAIAYPLLQQTQAAAKAGKLARVRQCSLYRPGFKMWQDGVRRGVISAADLQKYAALAPLCKGH